MAENTSTSASTNPGAPSTTNEQVVRTANGAENDLNDRNGGRDTAGRTTATAPSSPSCAADCRADINRDTCRSPFEPGRPYRNTSLEERPTVDPFRAPLRVVLRDEQGNGDFYPTVQRWDRPSDDEASDDEDDEAATAVNFEARKALEETGLVGPEREEISSDEEWEEDEDGEDDGFLADEE